MLNHCTSVLYEDSLSNYCMIIATWHITTITADYHIFYSYLPYFPLNVILLVFAYNSYMSASILALLGLMCRVQSNRWLRHKTISINVNPLNSFTRFGHHPAVTLLTYRPYYIYSRDSL